MPIRVHHAREHNLRNIDVDIRMAASR